MYNKYVLLRDNFGETDYQVAKDTEINPSMFSHWKNGVYSPKLDKLQKIAKHFNVPITYFLEEKGE